MSFNHLLNVSRAHIVQCSLPIKIHADGLLAILKSPRACHGRFYIRSPKVDPLTLIYHISLDSPQMFPIGTSPPLSDGELRKLPRRRRSRRRSRIHRIERPVGQVSIKIGNPQLTPPYEEVRASSQREMPEFQRAVKRTLNTDLKRPLFIVVSDKEDWLADMLASCCKKEELEKECSKELKKINEEVNNIWKFRFPDASFIRAKGTRSTMWTWSFIIDHVYSPFDDDHGHFRVGVWTCGESGYRYKDQTDSLPVIVIFTTPEDVGLHQNIFEAIYDDVDYWIGESYGRDDIIYWIFHNLWRNFSRWDDIIEQFEERVIAAEINSNLENPKGPASIRTRESHRQIGEIYNVQQYLRSHYHSFQRLVYLKNMSNQASGTATQRSMLGVGDELEDELGSAQAEILQTGEELEFLSQRFDNLTSFAANMETIRQAEDTRVLTIIATVFLPISFLASIWGMTEFSGSPTLFIYVIIPIVVVSVVVATYLPDVMRMLRESRTRRKHPEVYLRDANTSRKPQ